MGDEYSKNLEWPVQKYQKIKNIKQSSQHFTVRGWGLLSHLFQIEQRKTGKL